MPHPEEELIGILKKNGVDFTASLPCEKIKTLLEMVGWSFQHLPLTREEEGVGICAGAALAGRRPAMFVQSSGIGNMINALLSLTQFYELPLALFVSRRGVYQEKIEAQFPMGRKLPAMLSGAGITYTEINAQDELSALERELPHLYEKNKIHAFLLSPKVWEGSECRVQSEESRAQKVECEVKNVKREGSHMPAPSHHILKARSW
jgi:sulfopyruvate decarboxylase alpha subunit